MTSLHDDEGRDDVYTSEDEMWADVVEGCCLEADIIEALDIILREDHDD